MTLAEALQATLRGPLWVKSRRFAITPRMFALGGKADINYPSRKSPLIATSGPVSDGCILKSVEKWKVVKR